MRESADYQVFANAICEELKYWANRYPELVVKTIFFGGGTPSLMKPVWIAEICKLIQSIWATNLVEITLEANPTHTEIHSLKEFSKAGINRISFGVQSFNDKLLTSIGRTHSGNNALRIIIEAKAIFPDVSIDLMYNLPQQSLKDIEYDLSVVSQLGLKHVSYYALTIEDKTLFGQMYKMGKLRLPNDAQFCDAYNLIAGHLTNLGMEQYEISNFAFPGHESKHNLIYWKYENFLGIGPGAHSRLRLDMVHEVQNHRLPEKWLSSVQENGNGIELLQRLDHEIALQEELLMKLRLKDGLNNEEITRLLPDNIHDKLDNLLCSGDVMRSQNGFALTSQGFLKYNAVLRYLISA